jgi:hypothetical protein
LGDQINSLIDSSEGRDINCLFSDNTACSDSGRVFPWASLEDGIYEHLERIFSCEEMNYFEGVPDNSDGFHFLSGISAVELH